MHNPKRSQKIAFIVSLCFHIGLAIMLLVTFERTIIIPANEFDPNKPIINAFVTPTKTIEREIEKLEEKEAKEKLVLKKQQLEIERKEKEVIKAEQQKQKEKEKEIEDKRIAEEKRLEVENAEKMRLAKEKEAEEKVKKLKKKKEEEALAKKKEEEKALEAKKKALEKEKDLAKQKEEMLAQARERLQSNVRVKHDEISLHAMKIQKIINQNWRKPIGFDISGLTCKISVKLLPTGEVMDVSVAQQSGSLEFDTSAVAAVKKSSPLPMPSDAGVASSFREFTFLFRPEAA